MTGSAMSVPLQMKHESPSLLYAVKQVELAVRSHLEAALKPAGLTVAQYTALTVLQRRDGLSAAQLARSSFVTAQSMQDVVTALVSRRLITRIPDAAHRRRLRISLTEEGRAALEAVAEDVAAIEDRMTNAMSCAERDGLRRALNLCRAALRPVKASSDVPTSSEVVRGDVALDH